MSELQTREQMLSELSHHNVTPEDVMKAAREAAAEAYPDARHSILAAMVDGLYMVPIIARAILAERKRSRTALSEAEQRARREALEEAAKTIEEGFDRGIASKHDLCAHKKFEWEDCESCAANAVRALIPSEPHDAEGRGTPRRGDPSIFDDAEGRN